MVTVEGDTILLVAKPAATTATATVWAMVAATHALHIHLLMYILVRLLARLWGLFPAKPKNTPEITRIRGMVTPHVLTLNQPICQMLFQTWRCSRADNQSAGNI
jgi:hypothetical protein